MPRAAPPTAHSFLSSIFPPKTKLHCCLPRGARPPRGPGPLPTLLSRLRALPVVTLQAPDDAMLRAVIVKLAADRQLALDESIVAFIATRTQRSFVAARAAVIALDNEALRQRRAPTRALAAEIFRAD